MTNLTFTLPNQLLHSLRLRVLDEAITILAIMMTVYLIPAAPSWMGNNDQIRLIGNLAVYFIILIMSFSRQMNYRLKLALFLGTLSIYGGVNLISTGLSGMGGLLLLMVSVFAAVMMGFQAGVAFLASVVGGVAIISVLMVNQVLVIPRYSVLASTGSGSAWIETMGFIAVLAAMTARAITSIQSELTMELNRQHQHLIKNEQEIKTIHESIEANNFIMERRWARASVASQLAREISMESDLNHLMATAVDAIRDRFGFYHAGLFLSDETHEYAELRAATGEAGREMLQRQHRLRIGEQGMVGYVVKNGVPRVSGNVLSDPRHFQNPSLPETRSELAIPMHLKDRVIGALDVQSTQENAFTAEEIQMLQTIADQLAAAIDRARLIDILNRQRIENETRLRDNARQVWRQRLNRSQGGLGYKFKNRAIQTVQEISPAAEEAMINNRSVVSPKHNGHRNVTLAVPIQIHNQTIGVVDISFEEDRLAEDTMHMVDAAVRRLAIFLENTRLMEELQLRIERERMVSEISARVRASSSFEAVLQTAAEEISRSLGAPEVVIQLRDPQVREKTNE